MCGFCVWFLCVVHYWVWSNHQIVNPETWKERKRLITFFGIIDEHAKENEICPDEQKYEARCPDIKKKECTWYLMADLQSYSTSFQWKRTQFQAFLKFCRLVKLQYYNYITTFCFTDARYVSVTNVYARLKECQDTVMYNMVVKSAEKVRPWLSQRKRITNPRTQIRTIRSGYR